MDSAFASFPSTTPVVHILHDNPSWLPPFEEAFRAEGVPFRAWHWDELVLELDEPAPPGVFWSRLSASAHTRDAPHAKDAARAVLTWLESWGRRVVGGTRVAELEVSKAAQHAALRGAGIDVPRTVAVSDPARLPAAARAFAAPFIVKGNQGGKGLGVRLVEDHRQLDELLAAGELELSPDGITLVQEYLRAAQPFITRAEFVGGRFAYAVRVDITGGGFELCPAEACAVLDETGVTRPLFELRDDIGPRHPLVASYEAFLARHGIEIAGIEFVETGDERTVTYDVNTNTNYSPDVEGAVTDPAARRVARFLGGLLERQRVDAAA